MQSFKENHLIPNYLNSGITLVELIIAVAFSGLVISGTAFGITTMMQRNAILEARSQRRADLDRALNYIADEIKSANDVQIVKPISIFPESGTGVLFLTIPLPSKTPGPSQRVYFIRPSTSTWGGPNTINRYKGTISNPVTVTGGDNELVDGIVAPSSDELTKIKKECATNGGVFEGTNGFYACINETTNTVDLYLYGKLQEDPTLENLALTTRVSARGTPTSP